MCSLWQRRFWAHLIIDQDDFNRHADYIHWNSVKHGWVKWVEDWPHSSFHKFLEQGIYSSTWGIRAKKTFVLGNDLNKT